MTRFFFRTLALSALALITLAGGCARQHQADRKSTTYEGPTDPLDVVLANINARASKVTTLRCSGDFELTIQQNGKESFLNGQLTLLHTKPDRLRIIGDKDLAGRIFDLGTDGERFWLTAFGEVDTCWHGTNRGPGLAAVDLPISPELMIDVLGVASLNPDMLAQPVPTMRFNPDYDAYMLTWHRPITDRWATVREVWYDRQTLQPKWIWLFDRDGRVVLRAKLSKVVPVESDDMSKSGARMASYFDLRFPQTKTTMLIRLDQVADRKGRAPGERSYQFDPAQSGVSRVEDLDASSTR
jgi:hypothetical protein